MKQLNLFILTAFICLFCNTTAIAQHNPFHTEDVIRSADVVRNVYDARPTTYLYQGNGQFGSSYAPLGLHLHPTQKNNAYGKTQYLHLQHRGRGKFNADYLIPMLEIYWEKVFSTVSGYSQQQSYYDGVITTAFTADSNQLKVKTWFDPVEPDLSFITIHSSKAGLNVIVDPCKALTIHYGQEVNQSVSIHKKDNYWEITLECFGKKSHLYLHTNAIVTAKDDALTLTLKKGENYIHVAYSAPSTTSAEASFKQTKDWWHQKWNNSGCIKLTEDKAQKTWVRSMAMFLASYNDAGKGLAPPMGYTGNWWPFYYPQDVSYVHPILLSTGNLNMAKSWIEHWSKRVDGLRKYTKRLYKVEGILAPWVFPYGDFEGYHNPTPPNKFYYEIHNSGYFARMACETAVYVNDDEWTRQHTIPLLEGCAEFYRNICTKEADGLWHLYVYPSMGQDERGGENQKDYLCALYSARYCFQQAVKYGLDRDGQYARILKDGLAFESLKSEKGCYFSSAGSGETDFGKQKHPVQLNELAFLPMDSQISPSAQIAYNLRYDITRDAKVPFFYGWTLGEFLLAGSRVGDTDGWLQDWDNMERSTYVDPEWIQIYETSKNLTTPFYHITNGLVAQSLLNNLVSDWYGTLEIGKCNPWKGKVYVKNIHSLLGVIVDGEIEGKSYNVTLTAWKDTEFSLNGEMIKMKKGEKNVATLATARKPPIESLVPSTPSAAPDYFCTWNSQGYLVNRGHTDLYREALTEDNIFGKGAWQNWISFYPSIRQDLYFVMDDSWDIPADANTKNNNPYLGTTELNPERFPSFTGNPTERLKKLSDRIKAAGWKGAGGWICAQKAETHAEMSEEAYWTERIKAAGEAGFDYWKVDWGNESRNESWRRMLTNIGKRYAPGLFIEHAMKNEYIAFSDVFRTYDVENIIAQSVTIQRICDLLPYRTEQGAKGIINCEDEPYIAVGLGCAIGVMRYPFDGNLPNGEQDRAFPPVGRELKKRLDEVVRAVRWHRIAEPFAVDGDFAIDNINLEDTWILHADETWAKHRKVGDILKESAPARASRRMPLPQVSDTGDDRPFVLASRYPNGAVAVATIGRSLHREYVSKEVSVSIEVDSWDAPIGVFGYYKDVTLVYPEKPSGKVRVYAQDLAGDTPVDITKDITIQGNKVTIPGMTIRKIGLMNASEGDCSDPGMVIKITETMTLDPATLKIVLAGDEPVPLRLAVETLCNDFKKVTGTAPEIVSSLEDANGNPALIIVNRETNALAIGEETLRTLDGFESHRVYTDAQAKRIYLDGKDMRGAIYAVYTFDEQFLGVPPLWFWSSWVPRHQDTIEIPKDTDLYFKSPQVRYRSWLPNDTDLWSVWKELSQENKESVYETMLRLKLNTMEDGGLDYPGVNEGMLLCKKYGLVVTSHHIYMLNTTFMSWDKYWKNIRGMNKAPELRLSNLDKIIELWEYGAKTVADSGVENIWNIAFRGAGDQPFWIVFPDAPATEPERAEVINRMLQIQMDIIKKYAKEENPYVRITFYDEMADLVNAGLVRPPATENMIWTFCSGRRDHYPYSDIQQFNPQTPVKLGYYMNLQFTSTGSHLAPGEGPWKMEFNYRYVNDKSPLYLSVVNSGNFREFLYTMSANAKMLWDYNSYSTNEWNRDYAAQYFGEEHADEIAQLYKDYFYAFWTQRKPDFPGGMERQFIFQDQRHTRAIHSISETFFNYNPNPLPDRFGYERVQGRVFRVIPEDNGVENQVDAMLKGMSESSERFAGVTKRCIEMMPRLAKGEQTFFYDNLVAYSSFMEHLSKTLYHYTYAYKHQENRAMLNENLNAAYAEMEAARDALYKTRHGAFSKWYDGERLLGLEGTLHTIEKTREQARK